MSRSEDIEKFIVTLVKSFVILLIFGIILPEFTEFILNKIMSKGDVRHNSVLVYNVIDKNYKIFSDFIIVIKGFFQFI